MATSLEPLFISQAAADSVYADRFMVRQDQSGDWSLPRVEDYIEAATTVVRLDTEHVPADLEPYVWVSWNGLKSVLEFKSDEVLREVEELERTLYKPHLPDHPHILDAADWSVLIVKPDARAAGLEEDIVQQVENAGLMVALTEPDRQLTGADVERIWTPPFRWKIPQEATDWWYATVEYMCEAPVSAYLVYGQNATDGLQSIKAALRRQWHSNPHEIGNRPASERVRSLIHGSDRTDELVRNAALFWSPVLLRETVEELVDAR